MTTSWWSHSTSPYTPATNSADRLKASGLESLDAIWRFAEATKPLRHRDFVELRGIEPLTPSMPWPSPNATKRSYTSKPLEYVYSRIIEWDTQAREVT